MRDRTTSIMENSLEGSSVLCSLVTHVSILKSRLEASYRLPSDLKLKSHFLKNSKSQ